MSYFDSNLHLSQDGVISEAHGALWLPVRGCGLRARPGRTVSVGEVELRPLRPGGKEEGWRSQNGENAGTRLDLAQVTLKQFVQK